MSHTLLRSLSYNRYEATSSLLLLFDEIPALNQPLQNKGEHDCNAWYWSI